MYWILLAATPIVPAGEPAPAAQQLPVAAAAQAAPPRVISASTLINLEFAEAASSRTSKSGDRIMLRTIEEVRGSDNQLLIGSGSRVTAEVIQASPARLMGKAGELTLAARFVEVDGQKVPLKRFRFGQAGGKDNTGATMIATALLGLPGLLISGGNVDAAPGTRANAVVVADTILAANETSAGR